MSYVPQPIDTSRVRLPPEIAELLEALARNAHDHWALQRLAEGWTYGPQRDDQRKKHPCLVPYEQLPDSEREYDRTSARETLKAIMALGYRLAKNDS